MKRLLLISLLIISSSFIQAAYAVDYPHNKFLMDCPSCHTMHGSPGQSLMSFDTITTLCTSCHSTSGIASGKPMEADSIAVPGTIGTSHKWEGVSMIENGSLDLKTLANGGRDNIYGLRTASELANSSVRNMLLQFGEITCVACHQQHTQDRRPWDPEAGATDGTATGGGAVTIVDSTKEWTTDEWIGYDVTMTSTSKYGSRREYRTRAIVDNDGTSLTVASAFGRYSDKVVAANDGYIIHARHFQRVVTGLNADPNLVNDMCEDCHYYRTPAATGGSMDVRTYDSRLKSHPIAKIFSSGKGETPSSGLDDKQFNTAPIEPEEADWAANTGARYHLEGGTCNLAYLDKKTCEQNSGIWTPADTNPTNNLVTDSSYKIRCLSCHGVHYTDSESSTVDEP